MSPHDDLAEAVTIHRPGGTEGGARGWRAALPLVAALIRRDLSLHYRHTRLGVFWGIAPPLVAAGVLDLFLGPLGGFASVPGDLPYPIFLYAGLLPWQFLAHAASAGAGSVVGHAWLLGQVPFPRLVLPTSHVLTGLVDFLAGTLVLLGWTLVSGHAPGAHLAWWPVAVAAMLLLGCAVGVLLSVANVFVRDVQPATSYALQVLFLASPVLYSLASATGRVPRWLFLLNPCTGVLETFRSAWLGTPLDVVALSASVGVSLVVGALGLRWFQRAQGRFADLP